MTDRHLTSAPLPDDLEARLNRLREQEAIEVRRD